MLHQPDYARELNKFKPTGLRDISTRVNKNWHFPPSLLCAIVFTSSTTGGSTHDPSPHRAVLIYPQRMAARAERHFGGGWCQTFWADELHQLDRRAPGLA